MNALDYYNNPIISQKIASTTGHITSADDREDCQQDIWAELYDFMPLDDEEAIRIIERIAKRYKRSRKEILDNETEITSDM